MTMLSGLRILLAEDNATNQMVAIQMLETLGAEVVLAADGAEALDMAGHESFDVLLVDIEMPKISGIEVIRNLRADAGDIARVPMVALTAYVMQEHRDAIAEAGADGVIAKPIMSIERFGQDILDGVRARQARNKAASEPEGQARDPGALRAAEVDGIDLQVFETLAKTIGPSAMAELLGKVEADIQGAGGRVLSAMDAKDLAELRAATHILISVAGAVGATRLEGLAKTLNQGAHAGDATGIEEQRGAVHAALDGALNFVGQKRRGG